MADDPKPDDAAATTDATAIHPGMSEQEIRDAGLAVDVPYESGTPDPERLRYADLGMTWVPPADWPPVEPKITPQPQEADGAQGA